MNILQVFFDCDEFCQEFVPQMKAHLLADGNKHREREATLSLSEVMTILILFQTSGFRCFKLFYTQHVLRHLRQEFPRLVSYNRFVELQSQALLPLAAFLHTRFAGCSGISFVDSTAIRVCHNLRIHAHKVFKGVARRGRTSLGWFYGFKVHLVINDRGELLGVVITPGNVDDRKPVPQLARRLFGRLFGDRGYISQQLTSWLYERGVQLLTKVRKNMRNKLLLLIDKLLLRKRALVETVIDQLKNICQIEHTRHRSVTNFVVNLLTALIAYTYQEKKPSLDLTLTERKALPAVTF